MAGLKYFSVVETSFINLGCPSNIAISCDEAQVIGVETITANGIEYDALKIGWNGNYYWLDTTLDEYNSICAGCTVPCFNIEGITDGQSVVWNAATGTFIPGSGGGGSQTWQQTLITGSTLTQDNTVDLGGHNLIFENAGTPGAGLYAFFNDDEIDLFTDGVIGVGIHGSIELDFDVSSNSATFLNGNVGIGATPSADQLFLVTSDVADLIEVNKTNFTTTIKATDDDSGTSFLTLDGNPSGVDFQLIANAGTPVSIVGDAVAQTIAYSANNGHIFTGNVGIGATPSADQLLVVNDGSNTLLNIDKTNRVSDLIATDGTAATNIQLSGQIIGNNVFFGITANTGSQLVQISGDAVAQTISTTCVHHRPNLVEYATNGDAITGGLAAGDLYMTAGTVKIVT